MASCELYPHHPIIYDLPSPCASFIHLPGRGASLRAMRVEDKKRKKGPSLQNVQQRSEAMSTAVATSKCSILRAEPSSCTEK